MAIAQSRDHYQQRHLIIFIAYSGSARLLQLCQALIALSLCIHFVLCTLTMFYLNECLQLLARGFPELRIAMT